MDYRLEDLIDIPLLQSLQEKLNSVYSFPSAIIDNDGKVLTAVAWQYICTKFHRTNPECEKECIKSDQYILEHLHEANPAVSYQCPHGLVDNATPIIVDGKHLGNFFTGQFFLEKPDLKFFKKQAIKYGFDEKTYLEAVEKVPFWTKEKLALFLDFIKGFIEIIAGLCLKNLKEIETRKIVREQEERLTFYTDNSPMAIVEWETDFVITRWTGEAENIFGWSAFETIGKTIMDLNMIFEDDIPIVEKTIQRLTNGKNKQVISTNRNYRKDRSIITCEWYNTILTDENDKVLSVLSQVLDITERKQAEEDIINMKESLEMLNNRLEDIREDERSLIAGEIHDRLGQALTILKIDTNWLIEKTTIESDEGKRLNGMSELLTGIGKEVQRISAELRPPMLDEIGLVAALEWYIEEFEERTSIKCHLKLDDIKFPDEKKGSVLYRILQEALTNVIRHANAKNVSINLYQADDSVIMEVIDDGIGIKKEKINSYKSLGLIGVRERVKKYSGTLDVSSGLKKGTKLRVCIPLNCKIIKSTDYVN